MSSRPNHDLPKACSREERVFLDDWAREEGWSRRKLDYLASGRRIVFWQDSPRGRRYTTRAEIEAYRRSAIRVSAASLAVSNEGRIAQIEARLAKLESELIGRRAA